MTAVVMRGDARCLPLPDSSVDLIVTSPPYFGLRSYTDAGEHYGGQIGSEETPQEWLAQMLTCTTEWIRVLKPSGSMFINLGDKYSDRANAGASARSTGHRNRRSILPGKLNTIGSAPRKSLLGLPWRYAIGCIDELGLILRAEIIWSKPNGLPESVTDRVRRSHEQWFHFVKQQHYFAAIDEIRQPYTAKTWTTVNASTDCASADAASGHAGHRKSAAAKGMNRAETMNPLGALPGSVWEIATEPLKVPDRLGVDHFAAFPTAWPKRLVLGWSPPGICTACDGPLRALTSVQQIPNGKTNSGRAKRQRNDQLGHDRGFNSAGYPHTTSAVTITGYECGCSTTAPARSAVVLDPFGGTGTTALVASALGRIGISVDLSHDYSRLAAWRTTDRAQIAKALGVAKPPTETTGQSGLFEVGA